MLPYFPQLTWLIIWSLAQLNGKAVAREVIGVGDAVGGDETGKAVIGVEVGDGRTVGRGCDLLRD